MNIYFSKMQLGEFGKKEPQLSREAFLKAASVVLEIRKAVRTSEKVLYLIKIVPETSISCFIEKKNLKPRILLDQLNSFDKSSASSMIFKFGKYFEKRLFQASQIYSRY